MFLFSFRSRASLSTLSFPCAHLSQDYRCKSPERLYLSNSWQFLLLNFPLLYTPLIKRCWHCTVGWEERSPIHHIQHDWETGFWTDFVGDFALVFSSILPPDRIYAELALCWGKLHPLCELQTLVIEDPVNGYSRVGWEASEDHRCLYCDCGVDDLNDGLCHRLYKETEK